MTKRYPHPDGPKRFEGDELEVTREIGEAWVERGVVEEVSEQPEGENEQPEDDETQTSDAETQTSSPFYKDPTSEPDESTEELAEQPSGDLRGSAENTATPDPVTVPSNFEPADGAAVDRDVYANYAGLTVPQVLEKVKSGEFDRERVVMLERTLEKPRSGIVNELKE